MMNIQVLQDQYQEGADFLRPRKQRQVRQLVLFNNLQRGDENIASTTMFSLFNRVHSSLYSDVLTVKFIPPEDSDYKKTEVLNKLQQNDYREMEKSKLDYDWLWNTSFYGDGFCETLKWDTKRKMLVPEIVNNLMMVYDPYFAEPKEWRYYGKWITRSKVDLIKLQKAGLLEKDVDLDRIRGGFDPDIWSYKVQHDAARMGVGIPDESTSRHNQIYQIFEQFTYDEEGNRWIYWTDKDFSVCLRKKKLDIDDEEGWPIVRKQIFREPNSSISISVPDIIEDKHRAKSVLYNLMYLAAKDEANPIYAYNPDIVRDTTLFFQRQVAQHIPMDDIERGAKRLNTGEAVSTSLLSFVNILNNESADAIGTTSPSPIISKSRKSATGEAIAQQISDQAASLQSKILGNGEKEFWSKWYLAHLRHMKDADEKTITITNVNTPIFEKIKLENIKTKFPPKIEILSKREADFKELVNKRDMMQVYPVMTEGMSLKAKKNFDKFVFFPRFVTDSSTIDRVVPDSLDEIKAGQENDILEKDKLPRIDPMDDDETHLYVHYMAKKTSATWAHILAHEEQLAEKLRRAEMQMQQEAQGTPAAQRKAIKNNTKDNREGAVPLVQESGDQLARSPASDMVTAK